MQTSVQDEEIKAMKIKVQDSPTENIARHFSACNEFIHHARLQNQPVLVHCAAGVSRSVSIVCAYVMTVTRLGCEDVLKAIRGARKIANPNAGFHKQLRDYERSKRVHVERARLQTIFGADLDKFEVVDIITCNQLIHEFGRFVLTELKRQQSAQLNPVVQAPTERKQARERNYKFIDEDDDPARPWMQSEGSFDPAQVSTATVRCTCMPNEHANGSNHGNASAVANGNGVAKSAWSRSMPRSVSVDCPQMSSSKSATLDPAQCRIREADAGAAAFVTPYLKCTCYCTCGATRANKSNAQ